MLRSQTMNKETSKLEQEQIQRLAEIGDRLRQLREEHSLTLEQVATKTMIQSRILNAIETGRLDQLPEPIYIQGFIKRYANALGINGSELAKEFPVEQSLQAAQSSAPSWKDSPQAQLRPMHLYAAYLLLIVAAISGLSYLISRSSSYKFAGLEGQQPQQAASPRPGSVSQNQPQSTIASPVVSPARTSRCQVDRRFLGTIRG
jgi:cytoskeletal protein RodZ